VRGYAELIRRPGIAALLSASVLARLTFGVFDLALVLLVERATGSFALAGLALGAHAVGIAVTAPARGRLLDRRGARRVLPPLAVAHGGLLAALPAVAAAGADALLVAVALAAGALVPPLMPAMRLEWQRSLGAGAPALAQAYALDTVLQIGVYVVGPLLAAGVALVAGPGAAVLTAAGLVLVGGIAFAALARTVPDPAAAPTRGLGAIRAPGVVTLVVVTLLGDTALGVVDLALVAAAEDGGAPEAGGVLLALFTAGSVAGGALYGARTWRAAPARRLGAIEALTALALLPVAAAAGTLPVLGLLVVLPGALSASAWITRSVALDAVAPAGGAAEAYTWLSSANAAGIALGSVLGGALVDAAGPAAALLAAATAAALAALAVAARRRTLAAPPTRAPVPVA